MADVKWIKITTDIFDDEKILLIEALPDADSIIVIWFKLLCLAGKMNNSGVFLINDKIAYTDKMLAAVFRRKESTVKLALDTFEQFGMIEVVNDVITIPNWDKHQTLDAYEKKKERDRLYQAERRTKQRLIADKSSDNTSDVAVSDKEEDIDIEKDIYINTTAPQEKEIFIKITLNDKSEYEVTYEEVASYQELYPAVDVKQQFRNMKGWCDANPTNRKTRSGIKRFINGWLSKEQNRGGSYRPEIEKTSGKNFDANKGLMTSYTPEFFEELERETKTRVYKSSDPIIEKPKEKQLSKLQKHILSLPINKDFHFEHEGKEFWGTRYENSVGVLLKSGDNEQFLIDKLEEHLDELPDYK